MEESVPTKSTDHPSGLALSWSFKGDDIFHVRRDLVGQGRGNDGFRASVDKYCSF
jgi:hypothetical protein